MKFNFKPTRVFSVGSLHVVPRQLVEHGRAAHCTNVKVVWFHSLCTTGLRPAAIGLTEQRSKLLQTGGELIYITCVADVNSNLKAKSQVHRACTALSKQTV